MPYDSRMIYENLARGNEFGMIVQFIVNQCDANTLIFFRIISQQFMVKVWRKNANFEDKINQAYNFLKSLS